MTRPTESYVTWDAFGPAMRTVTACLENLAGRVEMLTTAVELLLDRLPDTPEPAATEPTP